jgi:hypothetical protein
MAIEYLNPDYVKVLAEALVFLRSGYGKALNILSGFYLSIPFLVQIVIPSEVFVDGELYIDGEIFIE